MLNKIITVDNLDLNFLLQSFPTWNWKIATIWYSGSWYRLKNKQKRHPILQVDIG